MREMWAKAESSPTTTQEDEVATAASAGDPPPAVLASGAPREPDRPMSNDWDEV